MGYPLHLDGVNISNNMFAAPSSKVRSPHIKKRGPPPPPHFFFFPMSCFYMTHKGSPRLKLSFHTGLACFPATPHPLDPSKAPFPIDYFPPLLFVERWSLTMFLWRSLFQVVPCSHPPPPMRGLVESPHTPCPHVVSPPSPGNSGGISFLRYWASFFS